MYKITVTFNHEICCQVFVSSNVVNFMTPFLLLVTLPSMWLWKKGASLPCRRCICSIFNLPDLHVWVCVCVCVLCTYCCVGARACWGRKTTSPHLACGFSWCCAYGLGSVYILAACTGIDKSHLTHIPENTWSSTWHKWCKVLDVGSTPGDQKVCGIVTIQVYVASKSGKWKLSYTVKCKFVCVF